MPREGNLYRYLQRVGQSWYVRVRVPPTLQQAVGQTHIRKALGTRDVAEANVLKWGIVKEIKAHLQKLRALPAAPSNGTPAALDNLARRYREALIEAREEGDESQVEVLEDFAADTAHEVEEKAGGDVKAAQTAQAWFKLATAKTPLLGELLERWLDGEHYKAATKQQHRAALDDLKGFLKGDRPPAVVTADLAVSFVEDWLRKTGLSYNTQRRKLNSLVAFWKWLGLRGYVERGFNPWSGFTLSKTRTPKRTPDKRPYSEQDLLKLFGTKAPSYPGLGDVMVLGLYTGARLDELCSLRMGDIERRQGFYMVSLRTAKGKTRERTIAVAHPHAVSVLARRWKKSDDAQAQLFPEFKPGGYDGKLSWAVSKAFGRFRDAAGLPRSVDFHSFRRCLITRLENLGVDQVMIARYVGHALPTLAFTVYSGGSTEQTSREVARRIKYSAKVEQAVRRFAEVAAER